MSNDNHRYVIHALLLALSLGSWSVAMAEGVRSIPVGQRQLFLDDDAIAKIEHLQRTLHQPEKRDAVIRSDFPGVFWRSTYTSSWNHSTNVYDSFFPGQRY